MGILSGKTKPLPDINLVGASACNESKLLYTAKMYIIPRKVVYNYRKILYIKIEINYNLPLRPIPE